jgi:type II secretory pathway component PulC
VSPRDDLSPEEKLLRLIRRSSKKSSKEKQPNQIASPKAQKEEGVSHSPASASINIPKKEIKFIFTGIKSINFVLINRIIIAVVVVVLALFSLYLFFISPDTFESSSLIKSQHKKISLKEKKTKPYSEYQQEIAKRRLFQSGPQEPQAKKVIPGGAAFNDLVKDLHLLGIVSADKPQAIIEDRRSQKTFFLYIGDYVGEIKVEAISSDKVVLEYKGETISLFL